MCYMILCITLCITNGDFRAFCVTHRTSVTRGRKIKTSDNSLIITRLLRAENGTRTRDLNLGKVALYQLSYFRNYRFRTGGTTASAPRLRASKPAFRDCKYKPKNLFCKIFRRILSQNYSCAARNAKKETPVQMRSRRHARRQRPAANGNKNKAAGNGSLIYIRIALRANPD